MGHAGSPADNATNGNGNGNGVKGAVRAKAAQVLQAVVAIVTEGFTFLTLSIDSLRLLLGPVIDQGAAFDGLAELAAGMDPGKKGNLSTATGKIFGTIMDVAVAYPAAFGTTDKNDKLTPWDTTALRADLERFLLLRAAAQSSFIDKANAAARVLGARLRAEIMPRYDTARAIAQSNAGLAAALDDVMTHFGHASEIKQAKTRKVVSAQEKQARQDARIAKLNDQLARSDARSAAIKEKQAAMAQLAALRTKK